MKKSSKFNSSLEVRRTKWEVQSSKLIGVFCLILIIYVLFTSLKSSLFFQKKNRLNMVFYGDKTAFYSFGFDDGVNYFIAFPADIKVLVPGGFGYYRLGALGKLVALEKNPRLYQKSFSAVTSSLVDLYFFPSKEKIYFGNQTKGVFFPQSWQILLYRTNASIFDRAYIFLLFAGRDKNQFYQIRDIPVKNEANETILDERIFSDKLVGYFYNKTYRSEKRNVQIIYTKNESNALLMTKILDGEGIRVVDLSYQDRPKEQCQVIEEEKKLSETASALGRYFNCSIINRETGSYDIIFRLGEREGEWAVE